MNRPTKLARILLVGTYRSALIRHGVAAGVEHEPILRSLGCRTIVDVGAGRGQFALAVRRCLPSAAVISFEPLSEAAGDFKRAFRTDSLVTLHQAAIAPAAGWGTMHVSGRDDSSSLLPITSKQTRLFPGTGEVGKETVPVGPLRDFVQCDDIEHPALLKVDVQGYELEVLTGCDGLLGHFHWIYVECSLVELYEGQALAPEVTAWLATKGYELRGVHNPVNDKREGMIQADFLFARA